MKSEPTYQCPQCEYGTYEPIAIHTHLNEHKETVLYKCQELLAENPNLNGTELAQAIAGGYQGNLYPKYNSIILMINDLKNEGKL